jgi:hypothetical protein
MSITNTDVVFFSELIDDGRRGDDSHIGFQQSAFELLELLIVEDLAVSEQVADIRAEQVLSFSESLFESIEDAHRGVLSCRELSS